MTPAESGVTATPPSPLAIDSLDMWAATAGLPEQVEAAVSAARGVNALPLHERVENVVVLGMGGSGIAGDVLVAVAAPFMPVPVTVVKGYVPPTTSVPAHWSSPCRSPATPRRRWRRRRRRTRRGHR